MVEVLIKPMHAIFFNEKFIDGALIGGASLDANVFADILDIYRRLKEK